MEKTDIKEIFNINSNDTIELKRELLYQESLVTNNVELQDLLEKEQSNDRK